MALCSERGCDCPANAKVTDWRSRRRGGSPAVFLVCDFHAQTYAGRSGYSVRGLVGRTAPRGTADVIDIRAALRRLGKLS